MRTVDVAELESNLRDLLRAVRAGETLRVVHDGEVVAELARPRPGAHEARDGVRHEAKEEVPPSRRGVDLEARLQALAEAGQIQRARVPRDAGWRWAPQGLGLDPATVQQLLDDVRADRWP